MEVKERLNTRVFTVKLWAKKKKTKKHTKHAQHHHQDDSADFHYNTPSSDLLLKYFITSTQ